MSWWKRLSRRGSKAPAPATASDGALERRTGTAEFEAFIAYAEFESGENLAHGAEHLANLLTHEPGRQDWLDLARRYAERAGGRVDEVLLPETEHHYASTEALRALFWAWQGRLPDAVDRLLQAQTALPSTDYLNTWALDWFEPAGALESLPSNLQLRLFGNVISRFPEASMSRARQLRDARRWAALSARVVTSDELRQQWPMLRLGLLRRAGEFEEALRLAGPLAEIQDWFTAVARGLVLRQMSCPDDAEHAFRKAIDMRPDDISAYLEAADTWLDCEGWAAARGWYEDVLRREPGHAWAQPSLFYCQWKESADDARLEQVTGLACEGNERAKSLWFRARGALPEPQDASANVLRQLRDQFIQAGKPVDPGGNISLRVSSLEAPSNALAFRLELASHGRAECDISILAENIPSPDPRQAVEPVEYPLWRYEVDQATPALPPPPVHILETVSALALEAYSPPKNWARASHVADALNEDEVLQVFACIVHPPTIPDGCAQSLSALTWLTRVQVVAMQIIAQHGIDWEGSLRRSLLYSALLGPSDWATIAAIRALAWVSVTQRANALDIHQHFERLEAWRPDSGYCCWLAPLYQSWLEVPILSDRERETLNGKIKELNDE
ncbi:tetratricopeptide repeat protein [Burkholderia ubonensis]|uniref:tetratricopeptide repeat protein n=1 Tax=Burkholderia ubonensis TaxID=101571 RepID=UPI000F579E08|nr:tetratricopeptide repeat protein [Burkholderia ubonensis]